MALNPVFKTVSKGAITFTGNTQGLSKATDERVKGTVGNVGAFICLDETKEASDFGLGTTFLWEENGSYAYLDIPDDSTVLYALLTWGGTYYYEYFDIETGDLSLEKNEPITFNLSNGEKASIDLVSQSTTEEVGIVDETCRKKYSNIADVTEYIKKSGGGKYSVEGIPSLIPSVDGYTSSSAFAGWVLSVVYENEQLPERTICLWSGGENVDLNDLAYSDIYLDGFQTSKVLDIKARLLVSAFEGDCDMTGDSLSFGKNEDNLQVISGVNNFADNFFASQINNDLGEIDTRGSFGSLNHDGQNYSNVSGARQGLDITNVDISSFLENSQEEALVRVSTEGDAYFVTTIGLQIDTPQMTTEFVKSADVAIAKIGDNITFTTTITNTGTENLTNIIFVDEDTMNTEFVSNTVMIDKVLEENANPNEGFSIGSLDIGESVTVSFVTCVVATEDNIITNVATIEKENEQGYVITQLSNEVEIDIDYVVLEIVETVDKSEALVDDILTYTVNIKNLSSTPTIDDVFYTSLDENATFIEGSVTIDGVSYEKYDPSVGFSLEDITDEVEISFKVLVNSSAENLVENNSYLTYRYEEISDYLTIYSNDVETAIFVINLEVLKSADSYVKSPNGVITFTFVITNTGTKEAKNVYLNDVLDNSITFVENSVMINDVATKDDITNGIYIGEIGAGEFVTVSFDAEIIENTFEIKNSGFANYEIDILSQTIVKTAYSNEVEIMILSAIIDEIVKKVDYTQAVYGDILTFSAEFENTGDTVASSVVLTEITSEGVEFVENSLYVNDVQYLDANLTKGVKLEDIDPLAKVYVTFCMKVVSSDVEFVTDTLKLDFSYLADETIFSEVVSNEVVVEILKPDIEVFKSSNVDIAVLGDIITYSFKVSNTGGEDLLNVSLTDLLDQNLSFIANTVMIDGVLAENQNPTSKIEIGSILVNESKIVSFDALVSNNVGEAIENQSTVIADYVTDKGILKSIGAKSNICTVKLRFPYLEIEKNADVSVVSLGDIIKYSVKLSNTGDTDLYEVIFTDILSTSVEFVEGSFVLNGEIVNSVDLEQGVFIDKIAILDTATIEYEAKVISGSCNKMIENTAQATFSYQYESSEIKTGKTDIAYVSVIAEISNFKQISLNSKVFVPKVKPDIKTLDNTVANIEIMDYYVVEVINGVSNEGQRLYGKKLIIHGEIKASIEYTEPCDSVHSAHWDIPFTTYIVLPKDYTDNKKIIVSALVENVNSQAITKREVEINTLALVIATIK
ncbi:MAG: DUF3794 domain-containing protein [Clostridia bacterium]